jgi:hypothetical protein
MKHFVISEMSLAQRQTFAILNNAVHSIPSNLDLPHEEILNCHILARALVLLDLPIKLSVTDGWYLKVWSHSWLTDSSGNVYDSYPVGTLSHQEGGILFVAKEVARSGNLYQSFEGRKVEFADILADGEEPPCRPENLRSPVERFRSDELEADVRYLYELIRN